MKLYYYFFIFIILSVTISISIFLIAGEFKKEKQLLNEYNILIKKIQKAKRLNLNKDEFNDKIKLEKIIKEQPKLCIIVNIDLGEKKIYYYNSGSLIATESSKFGKGIKQREYFRSDSTVFAITYPIYEENFALVTYYNTNKQKLGEEKVIIPPYLIYVLY